MTRRNSGSHLPPEEVTLPLVFFFLVLICGLAFGWTTAFFVAVFLLIVGALTA